VTRGPAADGPLVAVVATEDTAARWAAGCTAAGLASLAVPFAVVVPPPDLAALQAAVDAPHDLVVATSGNAWRFLASSRGYGTRAAAVGPATAGAMQRLGFDVDVIGTAGAEALGLRLVETLSPRHVLWLRGARANETGVAILRAAGFTVDEVVAYATADAPAFASTVTGLASRRVVWVFGSGAAAEAWLRAVGPSAAARALRRRGRDRRRAAPGPPGSRT
jgi:uroporphyrinogen-III synthase